MPPFAADDLLTIETLPADRDKPAWANLVAHVKSEAVPDQLRGPGLYALFLDHALFYIGLHVGDTADTMLPVLERWKLHVVGQTLRAKAISFSPGPLNTILQRLDPCGMTDDLAACLPQGRATDCRTAMPHKLLKGSHCTAQKAAFASSHWASLHPKDPNDLLKRITCLFQALPAGWDALLAGAEGKERGAWVREEWLRPAETTLVETFKPACNACVPIGTHRPDVDEGAVSEALETIFPPTLAPFDRAKYDARVAKRKPASRALVEAYAAPGMLADEDVLMLAEDEGVSRGELVFRRNLSQDGAAFVDALIADCPAPFEPYFTNTNDLRIRLGDAGPTLLRLTTAHGQLRCYNKASCDDCADLGLDASAVDGNPMKSMFTIDPASFAPSLLFAVAAKAADAVAR